MKTRGYAVTLNNPGPQDEKDVRTLAAKAQYAVVGMEIGTEEGTPHYQAYFYFENAISFASIKKSLPKAHIEQARGSPTQNRAYCTKDNAILLELGDLPVQGVRSDLDFVRSELQGGANMAGIVAIARSFQSIKVAEAWLTYNEPERSTAPEIRWFWGETGAGKTHRALEWLGPGAYIAMDSSKWWQGYDGHEAVLIDDFRQGWCSFRELLRLTDKYPVKIENKGGSRQFVATKIAITCPFAPEDLYYHGEDIQQLVRRVTAVYVSPWSDQDMLLETAS